MVDNSSRSQNGFAQNFVDRVISRMDRLENRLSDRMGPVEPEGFAETTERATGDSNRLVKQNRAAEDMRETGLLAQPPLPAPAPASIGHRGPGSFATPTVTKKAFEIKIDSPQPRENEARGRAMTQGHVRSQSTPPPSWAIARPDPSQALSGLQALPLQPVGTSIARLDLLEKGAARRTETSNSTVTASALHGSL